MHTFSNGGPSQTIESTEACRSGWVASSLRREPMAMIAMPATPASDSCTTGSTSPVTIFDKRSTACPRRAAKGTNSKSPIIRDGRFNLTLMKPYTNELSSTRMNAPAKNGGAHGPGSWNVRWVARSMTIAPTIATVKAVQPSALVTTPASEPRGAAPATVG